MKQFLALCLYNPLLFTLALLDVLKWLGFLVNSKVRKAINKPSRSVSKREWLWGQKYGLVPWALPFTQLQDRCVIIHCASVGEVVGIYPLIEKLLASNPELQVVVTTNTLTGKQTLQRLVATSEQARIFHLYFPIDLPWLMRRLIKRLNPRAAIIMEVELWPNFIRLCNKRKVPTIVVNGRLTDKTARGYHKFSWLFKPMLNGLTLAFVRNNTDKQNYLSFDFPESNLFLLGNIKFDLSLPSLEKSTKLREEMNLQDRIVLLAGSTHFGEEELIVKMYKKYKPLYPELVLLIAPRHPQRFAEVLEYLLVQDVRVNQQSKAEGVQAKTDVLLIDEMGLLSTLYGVCDIAFVGGSIADRGGHNPIEPASYAVPTLMGPHIYNNPEICQVLADAGGLKVVSCEEAFQAQLGTWLADPSLRRSEGNAGRRKLEDHGGLIESIAEKISLSLR